MSTSVNIFRSSGSSSSSGGGGGGNTAVGKGVFEYDYDNDSWIRKTGIRLGDEYGFGFTNANHRYISVTTDGNEPSDGGENILFSISSSVGDNWILKFHYQTNDEIYRSSISVTNPET